MNDSFTKNTFIFETNSFLIITAAKIGSTWCKKNINGQLNDTDMLSTFYFDRYTFEIFNDDTFIKENDVNVYNKIKQIWNNFLEKKEERNLIILYRNPLHHFISSFIEDFIVKIIKKEAYPYFYYFLDTLPISNIEKNNFVKDYVYAENTKMIDESLFNKHQKIFKHLFELNFDYYITNKSYLEGHYTPWLSFVDLLINSNKIDNSKIKFIDIGDGPLEYQLKKYIKTNDDNPLTNYFETIEHSDNPKTFGHIKTSFFSIYHQTVIDIINDNPLYKKTVDNLLQFEILYYNKIKNNISKPI
jgi:hypothetical protein